MNRIALVTTSFEGIDRLKPLPRHPDIDAFYFTDAVDHVDAHAVATWTQVIVPDYPALPSRARARYFKTQIHRLAEAKSYPWLVWADASLRFRNLGFVAELAAKLAELPSEQRLVLVPHPHRQTVFEEYSYVCRELENGSEYLKLRYNQRQMQEQMEFFAAHGMNVNGRLWASGFWIVANNARINACWDAWWQQILRYGMMDQLPLPPLIEEFGLVPQELPVDIFGNQYFECVNHQGRI